MFNTTPTPPHPWPAVFFLILHLSSFQKVHVIQKGQRGGETKCVGRFALQHIRQFQKSDKFKILVDRQYDLLGFFSLRGFFQPQLLWYTCRPHPHAQIHTFRFNTHFSFQHTLLSYINIIICIFNIETVYELFLKIVIFDCH